MAYVNLGQVIYPIGAIFASTSSTSPSSMFGGTWSQIVGDSCLMACSGNVGVYGGSKNITIENLPPHRHALQHQVDNFEFTPDKQMTILCGQGSSRIFAWPDGQQSTYSTGGGNIICLTPTDVTCGDVPRSGTLRACFASEGDALPRGDSSCVIFKISKSELAQVLKQYAHSQLDTFINPLTQPVQPVFMVDNGQLSQMVDSLDLKGLGMVLAERMNINSLLRKCLATVTNMTIYGQTHQESDNYKMVMLATLLPSMLVKYLNQRVVMPHTTTFPHTEHAIVGIELPNILGGVLC